MQPAVLLWLHFRGFLDRIQSFQRRPQIDLGSVFKLPLSILKFGGITGGNRGIRGVYSLFRSTGLARSLPLARSPGAERASPKVVRIGVGRQVRWQDLQSGRKSGGATWSRSASTVAELGVGPQVRWRDLEPDYKSGGETCGQTGAPV